MFERKGFDFIARYYDRLVGLVFGKSMKRAQTNYLSSISDSSAILVLGGGTGNWLNELLRINTNGSITYVDQSSKMIALARMNSNNDKRIEFRIGTQDSVNEIDHFDAVITFCYLDLFSDKTLPDIIATIKKSGKAGAHWLVVDFDSTSWWHRSLLYVMYMFFGLTTGLSNRALPDWKGIFNQSGLTKTDEELFYAGFISSSCWTS